MPLNVPAGTTVFIDANILHYALVPTPPFSDLVYPFVDRLVAGEIVGAVSLQVLAETQHKIMMSLVAVQNGLGRSNLVAWAKHHPEKVRATTGLEEAVQLLHSMPIRVLPIQSESLLLAAIKSTLHGLLTNDSTTLALMELHGINDIATNDDDFDRVPGITVWKPRL